MITKNYIKMCEKAYQLQKEYKSDIKNVHEGDKYICQCDTCKEAMFINTVADYDIDYINKRDMTNTDPIYKEMVDMSGVGCFGAFWDDEGFICLFLQEQLQEMILPTLKEKYNKAWDLIKINRQANWVFRIFFHFIKENIQDKENNPIWNHSNDMNELWLAFVMKEKYQKIWLNGEWVKNENR